MKSSFRYRFFYDRGGSPALGFLDINFGVLGIFIVIFAIRIIMVVNQGGIRADYIISFPDSISEGETVVTIHTHDEDRTFHAQEVSTTGNPCRSVRDAMDELAAIAGQSDRPIRLTFLIGEAAFRPYTWMSSCLSRYREGDGDSPTGYIPYVSEIWPLHRDDDPAHFVAEWRSTLMSAEVE